MVQIEGRTRRPFYKHLYFWVLIGIAAGALVGFLAPQVGSKMEPLADGFVDLITMLIGPIVFCMVVSGINSVHGFGSVGRLALRALLYFEIVTTVAMLLGLLIVNVLRPGAGVNANLSAMALSDDVQERVTAGESLDWYHYVLQVIPSNVVESFATGNILQILFFAVLFGITLLAMGRAGRRIVEGVDLVGRACYGVTRIVLFAAPVGAFAGMAYAIGEYGADAATSLLKLIGTFYLTAAIFIVLVLGAVVALTGLNIFALIRYIRSELLIALSMSSSEAALPPLMRRLEQLGCPKSVVGMTVGAGYSFNLDGTAIYLSISAMYIAQAANLDLSLWQQLGLLAVMLLTSKGTGGVTGGGFVMLATTVSASGVIPVGGLMLVFGIDKFMSECRAVTNVAGNAVAAIVMARVQGELDVARARKIVNGTHPPLPVEDTDVHTGPDPADDQPSTVAAAPQPQLIR
jgi:aerobic C4-dicarboxylate transport protein